MSATVVTMGPILRMWICPLGAAGACAEAEKATVASSVAERRNRKKLLDRMGHSRLRLRRGCLCNGPGAEPFEQVVANAKRVGDDRQRGIHGGARREKAAIDDIEIVDFVRPAVHVECRCLGIVSEANRAVLVRYPCERNTVTEEEVPREQAFVAVLAVHAAFGLLLHELFEFRGQAAVRFLV